MAVLKQRCQTVPDLRLKLTGIPIALVKATVGWMAYARLNGLNSRCSISAISGLFMQGSMTVVFSFN